MPGGRTDGTGATDALSHYLAQARKRRGVT